MAFSGIALAGGIGQGLQSFASAYQTALNYQLEKAKAQNLTDYQQMMAQARVAANMKVAAMVWSMPESFVSN